MPMPTMVEFLPRIIDNFVNFLAEKLKLIMATATVIAESSVLVWLANRTGSSGRMGVSMVELPLPLHYSRINSTPKSTCCSYLDVVAY